ncbi:MAG: Re/Si-specific NAD(P)(+) transhydrogenase subunit alpha [Planctomycetota bacterium]
MLIGCPSEVPTAERRVAVTPGSAAALKKTGHDVIVERGAGDRAGFTPGDYEDAGVEFVDHREAVFERADIVFQVRTPGAKGGDDASHYRDGQIVVGLAEPLMSHDATRAVADRRAKLVAMELLPRTTKAQSMDVLSSQANLAGYQAVMQAADRLPRALPMMMTAAGTVQPAKVLVIGAGVAGLQAIATAKRLGAVTSGYDVRAATKEQVQSLGAKFVELEGVAAEGTGGYAAEQSDEQKAKQAELLAKVVAESDVVITTAAIPGRTSPILVTTAMVEQMRPGSVVVDLAAERGGNCEATVADDTTDVRGVTIVGDTHLVSRVAFHASQLYANNLVNLLKHLTKDDAVSFDPEDEIAAGVLVTSDGQVVHEQVKQAMEGAA